MPKRKEDRRVQMSKTFLKEALISLLDQKHISHITIKELCELADVNRSTFYAHYANIYELLYEMENDMIERLTITLEAYVNHEEDPITLTTKLIEWIGQQQRTCEVLLSPHSHSSFEEKIRKIVHHYLMNDWKKIVTDERLFHYMSAFIISGSIEVVKTWLANEQDQSPKEIALLIYDLTNKGIPLP